MARKPDASEILRSNSGLGPSYGEAGKNFPQLCSWLCDVQYEDQSPKGRTRLTVERRGDRLYLKLQSADSGLMVEHYADNVADAVLGLELLLGHANTPWSADLYPLDKPKDKKRRRS